MRIALVSPYSWTYPGGVTRHIEALAEQYLAAGHDVRVLAPVDPDDRLAVRLHRGAKPAARELPEYVVPLGRTLGFPSNGAVSNLAYHPFGVTALRRELRSGGFDVLHIHEPVAPVAGWDALTSVDAPLVGTFHCYSENVFSNNLANVMGARRRLNRLHVRIAVSEAAAWTGRRFFGGSYRIIPNGVDVPAPAQPQRSPDQPLQIAFIGQAVERKGLPVLLRAFEALREHVPVTLRVVGVSDEELQPLMLDRRGVIAMGKCSDDDKRAVLQQADVLCAPSLGGESFGMVLTEAFAAGTPVVASDIAGYRDVVSDGVDGLLVPRGDATALAERLRDVALDRPRIAQLAGAARRSAQRYSWPTVASAVLESYDDAIALRRPDGTRETISARLGFTPADGERVPAKRLPTLEPVALAGTVRPELKLARRGAFIALGLAVVALAVVAVQRIGVERIGDSLLAATPAWVLFALGLMCLSMVLRGLAWHAILRAALPLARVRLIDA
ncbi:MAG: glycosyltransferase, partial [Actinomycetota bacterium]|nr:glycosyltransferase [Actinomycetota bacterium]